MVLKNIVRVVTGATLLVWSGGSFADEYKPDEFLQLDLSKAALSPKPLGPETQFAPVRIEANSGNASPAPAVQPQPLAPRKLAAHVHIPKTRVAQTRIVEHRQPAKPRYVGRYAGNLAKPRYAADVGAGHGAKPNPAAKSNHAARARLVHRRSNLLDAEAMDTRIQVWPCRSGGICNWHQP